jgi:hypothetical protein
MTVRTFPVFLLIASGFGECDLLPWPVPPSLFLFVDAQLVAATMLNATNFFLVDG